MKVICNSSYKEPQEWFKTLDYKYISPGLNKIRSNIQQIMVTNPEDVVLSKNEEYYNVKVYFDKELSKWISNVNIKVAEDLYQDDYTFLVYNLPHDIYYMIDDLIGSFY